MARQQIRVHRGGCGLNAGCDQRRAARWHRFVEGHVVVRVVAGPDSGSIFGGVFELLRGVEGRQRVDQLVEVAVEDADEADGS